MRKLTLGRFKTLPTAKRARRLIDRIGSLDESYLDDNGELKVSPAKLYSEIFTEDITDSQAATLNRLLRDQGFLTSNGKRGTGAVWVLTFPAARTRAGAKQKPEEVRSTDLPTANLLVSQLLQQVRELHAAEEETFKGSRRRLLQYENAISMLEAVDGDTPSGELADTLRRMQDLLNT